MQKSHFKKAFIEFEKFCQYLYYEANPKEVSNELTCKDK